MKVREVADELNLFGIPYSWKVNSFSEFMEYNGYRVINGEECDFEYEDATIIYDLVKLGYEQKDIESHYKDFLKANKLKDILAYVEDRGRMIWQGERGSKKTIVVR